MTEYRYFHTCPGCGRRVPVPGGGYIHHCSRTGGVALSKTYQSECNCVSDQLENVAADLAARGLLQHTDAVEAAAKALRIAGVELRRIADHFDMDGYGPDMWKSLATEMGQDARNALIQMGLHD